VGIFNPLSETGSLSAWKYFSKKVAVKSSGKNPRRKGL